MLTLVIHPHRAAEKRYAFQLLLTELLGIPFRVQTDVWEKGYRLHLPSGKIIRMQDHFFNLPEPLYRSEHLPRTVTELPSPADGSPMVHLYGAPHITESEEGYRITSDWAAAAFFMATRWEETLGPRDAFGRFPAEASLAYRAGFLHRPVVHEWAEALWSLLVRCGYPPEQRRQRWFSVQLSCDVDHPRLWRRPWERLRTLAGALTRGNAAAETGWWLRNAFGTTKDPYDTFDEWMDLAEQTGQPCAFHFLGQRPRHFDCWYALDDPFILQLLEKIAARGHRIGFHPSREAAVDPQRFRSELASVRAIAPTPVRSGRHHYLCFNGAATWRMWKENGLDTDSTLGYPEQSGFRTGLCVAYPVFDIEQSVVLPLLEQPLIAMDVSAAVYQQLSPESVWEQWSALKDQTRRFQGAFTVLWHNSSANTYFWAPYQRVFKEIVLK